MVEEKKFKNKDDNLTHSLLPPSFVLYIENYRDQNLRWGTKSHDVGRGEFIFHMV